MQFSTLQKLYKITKIKIHALQKMQKNCSFQTSRTGKIDFTQNMSDSKILEFSHWGNVFTFFYAILLVLDFRLAIVKGEWLHHLIVQTLRNLTFVHFFEGCEKRVFIWRFFRNLYMAWIFKEKPLFFKSYFVHVEQRNKKYKK